MLHTVLGARGAIGSCLVRELLNKDQDVRMVSRTSFNIGTINSICVDLLSLTDTVEVLKNSDVAYLCAGLAYNTKVWQNDWPIVMNNVISACKENNTKLIFFDNVYMYGKVEGRMTEDLPYNPCSKKGEVRARIAHDLETEMKNGSIKAAIARSADLYGPYISDNSIPHVMVFRPLLYDKKADWLINENIPHSFTYTIDTANAMYRLSQDDDSYGQIWHLPTCSPPLTGKEFIELAAAELNCSAKFTTINKIFMWIGGLLNPIVKETVEMAYQYEYPYIFDSSKYENRYNLLPTSYKYGVKDTFSFLKKIAGAYHSVF